MSACYQGETNESFTAREIFTCFPHNITQKRKGKSLSLLYMNHKFCGNVTVDVNFISLHLVQSRE